MFKNMGQKGVSLSCCDLLTKKKLLVPLQNQPSEFYQRARKTFQRTRLIICVMHFTYCQNCYQIGHIPSMLRASQDEITCFRISETWRKHATPCFRYVYVKVVRFRCIRSNGNARKRHETDNGNTGYPSCFWNGLTCFCHVSVYGFLQFCPVPCVRFKINMIRI